MATKKPAPKNQSNEVAKPSAKPARAWKKPALKVNSVVKKNEKMTGNTGLERESVNSPRKDPETGLNLKQQRFVDEYIVDLNATQAAIRAGYSQKTAGAQAFELLKKLEIQQHVEKRRLDMQKRTEITQDMVLQLWWEIATANPNELISYRRVCCRNCFGKDHQYQWVDEDEWAGAVRMSKAMAGDKPVDLPTNEGGYGFDATLRPHPKCPVCHGEGHGQVFAHDTRDASPAARALYAGVKQTKEGMEIKMRDQDGALVNIARHLGMFKDTLKVQGDEENPLRMLLSQIQGTPLRPKASE